METKRVLYLVQFPPPIHGVSALNKIVWEDSAINQSIEKRVLPIRFAKQLNELRTFRLKKIGIAAILYFRIIYQLIVFRPHAVYFSFMPIGIAFWRDLLYLLTIKFFRVKPILHLDNQGIAHKSKNKIYKKIYQFAFNGCYIIHVNEYLLNKELAELSLKNAKLCFVHNTIEPLDNISVDNTNKSHQILFLSHLFPEKGVDVLIDSFKLLHKNDSSLKLVIAGDSPSSHIIKGLKQKVEKLNLSDSIRFTGGVWNREKCELIANSSVFVLPSFNDCFPLVILEALHFGVPVITTNSGGLKTIFEDGKEIIFIDSPEQKILKEKLELLLYNDDLRTRIGNYGRQKANLIIAEFPKSMRKIFEEVLWP
ncbi:MAG: glycosyltransferase [Bacteroidales bacterium]